MFQKFYCLSTCSVYETRQTVQINNNNQYRQNLRYMYALIHIFTSVYACVLKLIIKHMGRQTDDG